MLARRLSIRFVICLLLSAAAVFYLTAPRALAYEFGPTVQQVGPEETVFDWTTQRCEDNNIPDAPVRAFRDASGQVQLTLASDVSRRMIGPSLNSLTVDCNVTYSSDHNADPAAYDDNEWNTAPYTLDGTTVYSLFHEEYQGWQHPGQCSSQGHPTAPKWEITPNPLDFTFTCWYNSITLATSTDAGSTYTHATPPAQLVASVPYQYVPDQPPYGYFSPSNIIRNRDGYFYAILHSEAYGAQQTGACIMRTKNLANPTSWRAWNGTSFSVKFIDPYTNPDPPEQHVCTPLAYENVQKMSQSLTYNSFFKKYLLVGEAIFNDPQTGEPTPGFYYSTSADLINWTPAQLAMKAEFPWSYECGDDDPVSYGVVLNPVSVTGARNFEVTAQKTYLYFTRFNYSNCQQTLDRDLIRIPIKFLATTPGPTTEGPP